MKPIGMLDLKAEFAEIEAEVRGVIDTVLDSQAFIGGPQVGELESLSAQYLGAEQAIAVTSGTDALLIALMTAGIGQGDEVITTPFTFFATAGCIYRTGAKPIFVDIDPETFNIDPQRIAEAITPRTKAIMPVHLFGQCADMDAIGAIAEKHGLVIIEDAAQAIGAKQGDRFAGTFGLAGCFSFYPTKNLGGFGEGGMVVTSDAAFAERCRQMRNHGQTSQYYHQLVGGNFRLDTMKAGILAVKLARLEQANATRRTHAAQYDAWLEDITEVQTPVVRPGNHMIYHQFSILTDDRDGLRAALAERKIGTGIYYPVPLHRQPCFADLGYREGDCPVSEACALRILSLPVHPVLSPEDIGQVANAIRAYFGAPARDIATEAVAKA